MKRVFVTGHRGYIGVHLTELLKAHGYHVTGCDVRLFDGCHWGPFEDADTELVEDVRNLNVRHLEGHDAVLHLAALSNDPLGDLDAELTYSINRDASIQLASLAKQAGISRFVFFGSCSVYGKGDKLDLCETDALHPVSAYAKSKVESESLIGELADADFSPVYMRNATAYGFSKMLRLDLVVNNLLGSAVSYNEIRIMSDGTPWRPLIHCRDIARAAIAFLEAPREAIHNRAVNVGGNDANYQVKDIGDQVRRLVPGARIVYTGEVGADPRDYRVRFDLLRELVPEFRLQYDLSSGMAELFEKMREAGFSAADFEGDKFVRLRHLKDRLECLVG